MNTSMKFRLIPLAAMIMASHTAHANNPRHDLEEVVVSASPIHAQHSDNARPIAVLNGDELRNKASATLAQTLRGQVGVSAASFGPGVGNPVIRGQSANRVKVMQDNLDTLDASNTSVDHANTTEPLLADQIEILRGPSTLRFGSGAIGGVVNVIDSRIPTKVPKESINGAIETRYTSSNHENASVFRLDGGLGQFAWHADGLYRDSDDVEIPGLSNPEDPEHASDGFISNSESRANAFSLGGSWIGERGYIGLSINQQENLYGIPEGAHVHHEEEEHDDDDHEEEEEEVIRVEMEQTRYDLKAQLLQPFSGFEKLTVRIGHNDYEHSELEGAEVGTIFTSQATEGRVEMVHNPISGWQGAIGVQLLDRDYGADGDEAFIPGESQIRSTGLFWIEEKHWQHQWIELGLRHEQQSIDPDNASSKDHNATSISAGYHWSLDDVHQFSISASRAERAPSLEELFSDGAHIATQTYDLGDQNLDVETSQNIDLGYQWQPAETGLVRDLKVNVFYNQIDDFIYQRNTGDEDHESELMIFAYEQQDAVFEGVEAELNLAFNEQFGLRLFGDAVRAEFDKGGDVPRVSPDRLGAELTVEQSHWFGSVQVIEVSEQNRAGNGEEETDGYTRLDAQINVPLQFGGNSGLIFLRADNLLDEEIRHSTSFLREVAPEAGRSLTAGVRLSF
ncbi:MAG: TonB-dependent receptor [Cellvibrionaceae bacterium]